MAETLLISVSADVMLYDDQAKQWLRPDEPHPSPQAHAPGGASTSSCGAPNMQRLSNIQLLQVTDNKGGGGGGGSGRTGFRILAIRINDRKLLINQPIYHKLKYQAATPTFHQWRNEHRQVFGLSFPSEQEAQSFHSLVLQAMDYVASEHAVATAATATDSALYQDPQYAVYQHSRPLPPGVQAAQHPPVQAQQPMGGGGVNGHATSTAAGKAMAARGGPMNGLGQQQPSAGHSNGSQLPMTTTTGLPQQQAHYSSRKSTHQAQPQRQHMQQSSAHQLSQQQGMIHTHQGQGAPIAAAATMHSRQLSSQLIQHQQQRTQAGQSIPQQQISASAAGPQPPPPPPMMAALALQRRPSVDSNHSCSTNSSGGPSLLPPSSNIPTALNGCYAAPGGSRQGQFSTNLQEPMPHPSDQQQQQQLQQIYSSTTGQLHLDSTSSSNSQQQSHALASAASTMAQSNSNNIAPLAMNAPPPPPPPPCSLKEQMAAVGKQPSNFAEQLKQARLRKVEAMACGHAAGQTTTIVTTTTSLNRTSSSSGDTGLGTATSSSSSSVSSSKTSTISSTNSTNLASVVGGVGAIGGGSVGTHTDLLSELAATINRRNRNNNNSGSGSNGCNGGAAVAETTASEKPKTTATTAAGGLKPWQQRKESAGTTQNGSESPKIQRKLTSGSSLVGHDEPGCSSAKQATHSHTSSSTHRESTPTITHADLEKLRRELMLDFQRELTKTKEELLAVLRQQQQRET